MLRIPRKSPPALPPTGSAHLQGLGGWLILVQIGLWVRPVTTIVSFCDGNLWQFDERRWRAFTVPGGEFYHALFAPVLLFETVTVLVLFVLFVTLIPLFYKRRYFLPRCMIILLLMMAAFVVSDALLADVLPHLDQQVVQDTKSEVPRAIFQAVIWGPYFLISKRVRATFVN